MGKNLTKAPSSHVMKSGLECAHPKLSLCRDAHYTPQFLTKMLEISTMGGKRSCSLFSIFLKAPFWGQKVGFKVDSRGLSENGNFVQNQGILEKITTGI